ncbi:FecR domain-containing protein [Gammaproteobacteria bacterium]
MSPFYGLCRSFFSIFAVLVVVAFLGRVEPIMAASGVPAGHVTRLVGSAVVGEDGAVGRAAASGLPVRVGNSIVTGADARLELQLQDGSRVTLGADTRFRIDEYTYAPRRNLGRAVFELVKGVFRATSGAITRLRAPLFEVHTSYATLGIRGTDFWGGFHFGNDLDVVLLRGHGVYVRNESGSVELTRVGAGTTVTGPTGVPKSPHPWSSAKLDAAKASVAWPVR